MKMVGIYHITLLTDADERAFVSHMTGEDMEGVLKPTRITSGFDPQLLERPAASGQLRQYAWHVTADLVTDAGYNFDENVEGLQAGIEKFGLVTGIDAYAVVGDANRATESG